MVAGFRRAGQVRGSALTATALLVLALVPTGASAQSEGEAGHDLREQVATQPDPRPNVIFSGRGWGHSAGLSQYGAYAMAREGRDAERILAHYYHDTTLGSVSEEHRVNVVIAPPQATDQPIQAVGGDLRWRTCSPDDSGACPTVTQPAGETWSLRTVTDRPNRIQLRDAEGSLRFNSTGGTVWTDLTDRDTFEPAATKLAVGGRCDRENPVRCYAYGRVSFDVPDVPDDEEEPVNELRMRNELPMEGYLRGIAEVPSGWGRDGGQFALEAQAIIARSYVHGRGLNTCATPACQVFAGYGKELAFAGDNWVAAVRDTRGQVVRDAAGRIANTFYSSSHGGRSEASEDSWAYGGTVPYLRSVDDPWSLQAPNPLRSWTAEASQRDLRQVTGTDFIITRVEVLSRTSGGSPKMIRLHGRDGQTQDFGTTPASERTRNCNRERTEVVDGATVVHRYAGNSLRCDLPVTPRDVNGTVFAGASGRFPSSQFRSTGFAPFDDDDGSIHEYAIVFAQAAGIAGGTSETTYAPRRAVTRGQMARFLFQTFELPRVEEHDFSDVPAEHTHATQIASIADAGIAGGYPDGTFRPNEPVTRQQMATFLTEAMGLTPRDSSFSDVEGVHARNIGAVAHAGITQGCAPDRYCPADPVTRDQMATFLYRAVRQLR